MRLKQMRSKRPRSHVGSTTRAPLWPYESAQFRPHRKVICAVLVVALLGIPATMLFSQDQHPNKLPANTLPLDFSTFEGANAVDHPLTNQQSINHISLSFSLQEWSNEFGIGLQITSPWFLHEKVAARLGGFVLWKHDTNWATFYALRLGLIGANFMANSDIRLYGEGGFLFLFPNSSFDSDPFAFGGYGHFGFEFFLPMVNIPASSSYFIELGSNGTGAKTNSGQSYLNGFSISTGLRVYL